MTRTDARAESIRAEGAEAVVGDAFDRDRLQGIVVDSRPDAVINQLTPSPGVCSHVGLAAPWKPPTVCGAVARRR